MNDKNFGGWITNCRNCKFELKYTRLGGMNAPHVTVYSQNGRSVLYSNILFDHFEKSENMEQDADVIINEFEQSLLGGCIHKFSIFNEMKCPNCNFSLTSRNGKKVSYLLDQKDVFLDGMTFVADDGVYKVSVSI